MTRSHKRAHIAAWDRIKRRRELKRDGQLLDMPEVNFMSQSNGYTAPQGRPRSSPPSTWMSDMIADHAALTAPVENPAPLKKGPKGPNSTQGLINRRKLIAKVLEQANRKAKRLNNVEPIEGATWMTMRQFAKAAGIAEGTANTHFQKQNWPVKRLQWGKDGIPIRAVPNSRLLDRPFVAEPAPDLPIVRVIAPPMVPLQPSLWSRFCQWVGW